MAKILHIVEAFEGGVFTSVTQICNGLANKGHEVHLAFSLRDKTPKDWHSYLESSISVHQLNMTRSINLWKDIKSLLQIKHLFHKIKPDVIHLHSSKAGFLGRLSAFMTGNNNKTYYSPRGLSFLQLNFSPQKRRLFRWLEWLGGRFGGTVIACSKSEQDCIKQYAKVKKSVLIENAIDTTIIPKSNPKNDNKIQIGTSGRITEQKNAPQFAELSNSLSNNMVTFHWLGGGETEDSHFLDKNKVHISGWLKRSEVLNKVSQLDVYIQTSLWEGMPLSVIEAQVAGVPAVVTDVVGNRDVVIHGKTGFIAKDVSEMQNYCEKLINEPQLRKELGNKARMLGLKRFCVERMLNELIELYGIK